MKYRYYRSKGTGIIWRFRKVTDRAEYYNTGTEQWMYGTLRVMGGGIKSGHAFERISKDEVMVELI